VLGTVPRIRSRSSNDLDLRLGKEAFRSIRTNLRFALGGKASSLAITSAEPSEGKSTVASNLALSLTEQGLRVVLVDADVRRPRLHSLFDMRLTPGLTELLHGEANVAETVQTHPSLPDLDVISGGTVAQDAAELVARDAFPRLLTELERNYDVVLIDTAPILAFADALLVSVVTDGTLLVARARQTDTDKLKEAANKLRRVRAPVIGVVLNALRVDGSAAYYYEYYDKEGRQVTDGAA
jgi:capsular exopolysaccharide synthesis family protein